MEVIEGKQADCLLSPLWPQCFRLPAGPVIGGAKGVPPPFARPTAARIALVTSLEPSVELLTDEAAREATVKNALDEHEKDMQVRPLMSERLHFTVCIPIVCVFVHETTGRK